MSAARKEAPKALRRYPWREAALVSGIYALLSTVWILGSGKLASAIAHNDAELVARIETYKGLFFVYFTSLLLFIGVLYVVRRRERYLAEQQRMQNLLSMASRYESLGQLAGSLAHDFNNVLTIVQTSAELAENSPPEEARAFLSTMRASVLSSKASIRQLLAFARSEPTDFVLYDLGAAVTASLPLIQGIIGPQIHLVAKLSNEPLQVKGVRDLLIQGLLNLCSNARDAMADSREKTLTVSLTSRLLHKHRSPFRKAPASGQFALLEIQDSGSGIPREVMQHLFTPLFTTKAAGKGTGLGLASALRAAQLHDGWIDVHSTHGEGSRFIFCLPLQPPPSPPV